MAEFNALIGRPDVLARAARAAGFDADAVEAALPRVKAGKVMEMTHWHDQGCPRPQGGPCTCKAGGPEVELRPFLDPEEN